MSTGPITPPADPMAALLRLELWPQIERTDLGVKVLNAAFLARLDSASAEEMGQFQLGRLSALLNFARENSPAWAARLERVTASRRWTDVPLLSREAYREIAVAGSLPLPPALSPATANTTSGSSGIPMKFYTCARNVSINQALYFYEDVRQGVNDGRARAVIMATIPRHEGEHVQQPSYPGMGWGELLVRHARQFTIEAHARWLVQTGARLLMTVPAVLRGMLDVYEHGQVPPPRLDRVFTYAETVEPELRARTLRVLGAPLRDRYSCEEIGPVAFQCPHGQPTHHSAVANVRVEVLRDDHSACAAGELGRIILTGLNNYASPAIRYDIGDIGAIQAGCPCGYAGPVFTQILGRTRFLIRLPTGERTYVGAASRFWLETVPVRERRIVQREADRLTVEVVRDAALTPAERQAIVDMMRQEISPDLSYDVVELERIDWGPTYKRQDVVSLI